MPSFFTSCLKKTEKAIEKELTITEDQIINLFETKIAPLIEKKIESCLESKGVSDSKIDINSIVTEIKE
jgi:hypothetical protein